MNVELNQEDVQNIINAYDKDIKKIKKLEKENQRLNNRINELEKYKKAIYEIKEYIDAYSPYFLETQEENNQTIAIIINNIGN